jgi:SAM-dependent methyltransferase
VSSYRALPPDHPGPARADGATSPAYFEAMYASGDDPWGFDSRWYERRKYALTVAALPRRRYRRALEAGCANGALTELLAPRCRQLVAFDLMPGPVAKARSRLAGQHHVQVCQANLPHWWPAGSGDLVVWSEVAYYLSDAGLDTALAGLERWLEPHGDLVAVHYTGATNYPQTGDGTHRRVDREIFLQHRNAVVDHQFRIDVWRRTPAGRSAPGNGASA